MAQAQESPIASFEKEHEEYKKEVKLYVVHFMNFFILNYFFKRSKKK